VQEKLLGVCDAPAMTKRRRRRATTTGNAPADKNAIDEGAE
jgi:hypothetical protein